MAKRSIEQVDVSGQRVLLRVDFNVPLDASGAITDDRRIQLALPTIRSVIDRGGRLVLASHLGRPAGTGCEPKLSLRVVSKRLEALLPGTSVAFPDNDCTSGASATAIDAMRDGDVVLLENLRFHAGEKKGDAEFAARIAAHADVYANDAFGTAHRTDASMVAVPEAMGDRPRVAGLLLMKELAFLQEALDDPRRPFVAVLGGAKVSDKLGAIRQLLDRVDTVLVGGAMAYTYLQARGVAIGSSRCETEMVPEAAGIVEQAAGMSADLLLPVDHRCAQSIGPDVETIVADAIPDGWMGLDIGPATAAHFASVLENAGTIVWNGPMGVFEVPPFDEGSRAVAQAIASATGKGAVTVIGGGDTAAAIATFGLDDAVSHVSTGGGASLRMLEGPAIPKRGTARRRLTANQRNHAVVCASNHRVRRSGEGAARRLVGKL